MSRVLVACDLVVQPYVMMMTMKIAPVADFPAYRITDEGDVQSRWQWGPFYGGMPVVDRWVSLPLKPNSQGYIPLNLRDVGGKGRRTHLHRLMAEAFISPPPTDRSVVRHLDGDPSNNTISNLAWGSYLDNEEDKRSHGTHGLRISNAKLTQEQAADIRVRSARGESQRSLAAEYGVSRPTITRVVNGSTWR